MNATRTLVCLAVALSASTARSHGIPIIADVVGNKVTVSSGLADPNGYASMIFADGSEDAQLAPADLPGYGSVALTDLPGFIFQGMAQHSVINLEIIPRPAQGTNPIEQRALWHWSPITQTVALAPNDESLAVVSQFDEITIRQPVPAPRAVFITHLEPHDIGQHRHFLRYLLDDSPNGALGAYAFFARFLVAPYQPSDPLLIVLNHGLDEASLLTAALAINLAAADAVPLDGDYNNNGVVDAADFVVWRKTMGQMGAGLAADGNHDNKVDAGDYGMWQRNFGRTPTSGTATTAIVPEPSSSMLVLAAIAAAIGGLTPRPRSGIRRIQRAGRNSIDLLRTNS